MTGTLAVMMGVTEAAITPVSGRKMDGGVRLHPGGLLRVQRNVCRFGLRGAAEETAVECLGS